MSTATAYLCAATLSSDAAVAAIRVRKDYQVTGTAAGEKDVAKWCSGNGGKSSPKTPYTFVETLGFAPPAAAPAPPLGAVGNKSSLVVNNPWSEPVKHTVSKQPDGSTEVTTAALKVVVSAGKDPTVSFFNASTGAALLTETGREFASDSVTQSWDSPPTESLYGLGHYNFVRPHDCRWLLGCVFFQWFQR